MKKLSRASGFIFVAKCCYNVLEYPIKSLKASFYLEKLKKVPVEIQLCCFCQVFFRDSIDSAISGNICSILFLTAFLMLT